MAKIAFIGAGSTVFARNLLGDILGFPELSASTIALMDIDPERLRTSEVVAHKVAEVLGAKPVIEATLDRRAALDKADYVISMIQVAGYRPGTLIDFEIPKSMACARRSPTRSASAASCAGCAPSRCCWLSAATWKRSAPAHFLQYVNPMAMNCWAIGRSSSIRTVGLCHSVQGTAQQLADDIGVPYDEIDYLSAGINHMAFYLKFARNGEDLYPRIRQVLAEGRVPEGNRVRYEALKHLGYFVTESSEHFARVRALVYQARPARPDRAVSTSRSTSISAAAKTRLPPGTCCAGAWKVASRSRCAAATSTARSSSTASRPARRARSMATCPTRGVTLRRTRARPALARISNLPAECCVEVPCLVDARGIQPQAVGALPPQLAALMQTNINVQALTVEAALTHKREHVYHAAMLDPHTAAELSLDQIVSLVDDLLAAHGAWIPEME